MLGRRLARDGPAGPGGVHRRTGADELIVTSQIFDHAARLRSYELTAALREGLTG